MIKNLMINASKTPPVPPTTFTEMWGMGNIQSGQLDNSLSQFNFLQVGTATTWVSGSAGQGGGIAIQSNGTMWGWGNQIFGQLGFNDGITRSSPVQIGTLNTWNNVSSRDYATIAKKTDGTLWSWGINSSGQLGLSDFTDRSSPVQIGTLNTWTGDISAGQNITMMIRGDGTLWGMGDHKYGMLGWGFSSMELLTIDSETTWVSASAGTQHTVALKNNGTMWSWGVNVSGQLGQGSIGSFNNKYSPVQIGVLTTWSNAKAGSSFSMAIKTDGTLWSWGINSSGQLGLSDVTLRSSPVQIGTRIWNKFQPGSSHTIAIRSDGTLWSWGNNNSGQLGDNTGVTKSSPVQIGTLNTWSIAATTGGGNPSAIVTAAIKTDGTLWIWGNNSYGSFGNNTQSGFVYRSSPVQIGTETNWASVSLDDHVLALKTDGTLWAWGNNDNGQLGIGAIAPTNSHRSSPVQIGTLNTWSKVFAGVKSSAVIKTDGTLWAWGINSQGQLGFGDSTSRSSPVQVGTLTNWSSADINANAMFAVSSAGRLYSVGIHVYLGRPNILSSPVQIGTLNNWSGVSVGISHTMAVQTNGTLWAWGLNPSGVRGDNTPNTDVFATPGIYSPVQIGTLANWSIISAASRTTHGIKTDGTLWGWGNAGENGLFTSTSRSSPVQIGTRNDWSNIQSSAVANAVILALRTDNTLWGWGSQTYGQLGDGTSVSRSSPIQIRSDLSLRNIFVGVNSAFTIDTTGKLYSSGDTSNYGAGYDFSQKSSVQIGTLSNWKSFSAGGSHTIAISQSGSLWAFGLNNVGQLGDGTVVNKNSPVQIGTLNTWVSASCGPSHTIAMKSDGTMWSWGLNSTNALGDLTSNNKSSPVQIGTLNTWVNISSGFGHVLALKNNGTLWAWGYGPVGALGDNTSVNRNSPVQVGADTNWSKISAAGDQSFAIKTTGTLWGWGDNSNGGVGDNTVVTRSSPVQIGTRNDWTNIPTGNKGNGNGFAVRSDGTMWSWGYGINHQLGLYHSGSDIARVDTQLKFTNISAGGSHSMAVAANGTLWGWGGNNTNGQLGTNNTTTTTSSPVQIGTLNSWSKLFASWSGTMAIKTDGTLWGWGRNTTYGQLGDNTVVTKSSPVQIGTLNTWSTLAVGNYHTLALKTDGTLWSWGFNGNGELGQNIATATNRSSPVQVGTETNWAWIGAGSFHSLAVKTNGTLWTWGRGTSGELGSGVVTPRSSPVQLGTLTNWSNVQGGGFFSMAIKTDGTLWSWGSNGSGRLGDGTSTNRSSPVQVGTLNNWSNIYPGEDAGSNIYGSCAAIKTDGTLWAWGMNGNGQNGQGEFTIIARSSPVQIGTNTNFASGSFGQEHGIALLNDGTLASWGIQFAAVLGQNLSFNINRSSPTQVGDFNSSWSDTIISVGQQHTVARKSNGTLWSWGGNVSGQLGHNDVIGRSSPVQVGTLNNWKLVSAGNIHTVLIKEYTQ
jgi:alpha-tubulin suppressor-like RCC1 family protein